MISWFKNLSLVKKQIFALLLCGLLPLFASALVSGFMAHKELKQQAFAQLESSREAKASAIDNYFSTVTRQLRTMAHSDNILNAMISFPSSFNNLAAEEKVTEEQLARYSKDLRTFYQDEYNAKYLNENNGKSAPIDSLLSGLDQEAIVLQHQYIFANDNPLGEKHRLKYAKSDSIYHRLHRKYHPSVREFLEEYGYYDIFLVDIDSGDIVYSVFKELDFATSLLDGPYSNTNFAEAFKRARTLGKGETVLVDYQPYTPSYEAPASFAAAPIYRNDKAIGVLIFQMPLEPVNAIMSQRAGMGESGESYLVGGDHLMRSDSYRDPTRYSVVASFSQPESHSVDTKTVALALEGNSGTKIVENYLGDTVLSAYAQVDLGEFQWAMISEIKKSEAFSGISTIIWTSVILSIIASSLIVWFALQVTKITANPVIQLGDAIQEVQRSGEFDTRLSIQSKDELGATSQALNQLLQSLQNCIQDVNNVLSGIAKGDYQRRITTSYNGSLQLLTDGVNTTCERLAAAQQESARQTKLVEEKMAEANRAAEQAETAADAAEIAAKDAETAAMDAESAAKEAESAATEALVSSRALDASATPVAITDNDKKVIYQNASMLKLLSKHESNIRTENTKFHAANILGRSADQLIPGTGKKIDSVRSSNSTVSESARIGNLSFHQTITPIKDDNGNFYGAVIELEDHTDEVAIEREVDQIIAKAAHGDFSKNISVDGKEGFFLRISEGLNLLVNTTNSALTEVNSVLSALAKGDLTKTIDQDFKGEFGQLKNDVNATVDKLKTILSNVKQGSDEIHLSSDGITHNISSLNSRTEQQAASIKETASTMEQMTQVVKATEDNAQQAVTNAKKSAQVARKGNDSMQQIVTAMSDISRSSKAIGNIISTIDEIAFQTNLLALNAAVEAARAGEQGRGFAVVAGEVRSLAQRSATAAKEIKSLINASSEQVQVGSKLVEESGETLRAIVNEFTQVGTMMETALEGAKEQAAGITEVNNSIASIDRATQQNAIMAEDSASSASKMSAQANKLKELISFFSA